MAIGTIIHDAQGAAWVYVGFRVTTTGSHSHSFVRALTGARGHPGPLWTYSASNEDTLRRKFPDLPMSHPTPPLHITAST